MKISECVPVASARSPLVLIIDDDADISSAIERVLTNAGYRVRCAADGAGGLNMARLERPDIILLDLMMPGKSGFEVCARLGLSGLRDVPVLVMTSYGGNIGAACGMDEANMLPEHRLEKPLEFNVLLDRIEGVINGRNQGPARKNN